MQTLRHVNRAFSVRCLRPAPCFFAVWSPSMLVLLPLLLPELCSSGIGCVFGVGPAPTTDV